MPKEQFSTADVVEEVRKLQYLYQLKRVIRFDESRPGTDSTESVAEHIYGLQILARYFLPLESECGTLDQSKVWLMVLWHDIDEVEVGDILGYKKTPADVQREEEAEQRVIAQAPASLQAELVTTLQEYRRQDTREARFVKALDKLEPLVQLYNERGKLLVHRNGTTAQQSLDFKMPYLQDFPYIKHFSLTLHSVMEEEGYFAG